MDTKSEKHISAFKIDVNSITDKGEGYVEFKNPLTITDTTEQRNSTKYDIKSMDLSEYNGRLTADHGYSIEHIIGKVQGIKKNDKRVTIDGIQFATKESALALFAKNMLVAGYLTDFSIETYGPYPEVVKVEGQEDQYVYKNSKLVGLSAVVIGNNKSAHVNEFNTIAKNSLEEATGLGLDTSQIKPLCYNVKSEVINSTTPQMDTTTKPPEAEVKPVAPVAEAQTVEQAVKNAVQPLMQKIEALEKNAFDKSAKEPEFKTNSTTVAASDYKDRHGQQISLAWDMLKNHSSEAAKQLNEINTTHMNQLKEAGFVKNSVSLADFGNFVISPELLRDIQGQRSDFTDLLSKIEFKDTLSLSMAYLKRSGDISMSEVSMEDASNGNLKPVSDYSASIQTSTLHELAAVTPVCNAATRFLAADLLSDVAAGYRNDFDRKKSQLFIARLQQAINETGNTVTYSTTSDLNALKSWVDVVAKVSEGIMNGVFVLSHKTKWELIKRAIGSGVSGNVLGLVQSGDMTPILGAPAIVVPNELLPTLNTAETKTFVVGGTSVTVNKAIFYTDLSTFTGRTSGGLQYDLSTEASYEEGGVTKSAFQRNELVLRGSFFRGGAVKDTAKVAALGAPGVS